MASYVYLLGVVVVGWLLLRWVWKKVKPYFRREVQTVRTSVIEHEEEQANRLDDNECCVCLVEPKVFRVAVTCGHSYCADCIFKIYAKQNFEQIKCPYCNSKIITIFKAFS
jgi:DNA-directed RNA polymerase subunit RPC12/RpoP